MAKSKYSELFADPWLMRELLIPSLIDQNPFAQWRNPRVMMRQG